MRASRALPLLAACATFLGASAQIQVTPLLDLDGETSEPSLSPDGKTIVFEWCKPDYSCAIYTRPIAGGDANLFVGKDRKDGSPAYPRWSPDGKRIAFARFYSHYDNHLFVRERGSGVEQDLGTICDRALESSWSPDGRFLIASVYTEDPPETFDCRPALFSVESGIRVRRMAHRGGASAFSPDGRMLAYADGKVLMLLRLTIDYRPTNPAVILTREAREISGVSWTPDGKQIIYQCWGDVPYYRRATLVPGARPQAIPGLTSELAITQLLADGSFLASQTTQLEALWRADLRSTPLKLDTVVDPGCSSGAPGCSPDGRLRAFITTRTGISEIWLSSADGTNERSLVKSVPAFTDPKDDGVPSLVGWSPDGKWIAFTVFAAHGNADVRSYLYVLPSSGGILRRLGKQADGLYNPTWSRDSKSLYATREWSADDKAHRLKSTIVRVDVADGKLASLGADGIWPRVSSDGKFLYFFTSPRPKLSRIPIGGGAEERLWDKEDLWWLSCAVGGRYLYLFQKPPRNDTAQVYSLIRFDQVSKQSIGLAGIPFQPRFAYLSPDERFLYLGQQEDSKQRAVLVRGLFTTPGRHIPE